ncbi:MAG TPA: L-threonylcarbamoyladenylate synthase [Verrucomicrobiae bacterium]|jgi:L-threonylcarbamoyladenylate synthase|nr:L-threonylcarbamoyladenylate synthase [Verrucomicrobiae bacterium]
MSATMATEILSTHTPALFNAAVKRAAELLRAGEVVALPTETVYGLAANALDEEAVAQIYEIKGRPAHNPIIVHVAGVEMAKSCVAAWPAVAEKLARAFWPGPLTMVLPRAKTMPEIVTAGGGTVGVRWPGHPFMQAVIRECGFPLAAPSANLSNEVSPTNATHVSKSLGERISLIVDGGQAQVGIESTVVDVSVEPAVILRPGMIHAASIQAVIGNIQSRHVGTSAAPQHPMLRSPGMLKKHYSPKAKLLILDWNSEAEFRAEIRRADSAVPLSKIHVIAHTCIPSGDDLGRVSVIPHDAEAFARALYAEWHHCDEAGAELIVVENPPQTPEWSAIHDRLKRAAAE